MLGICKKTANFRVCLIFITNLLTTSIGFAQEKQCQMPCFEETTSWHTVLTAGIGVVMTSDLGRSTTFPIVDPVTDEFFIYNASHSSQTVGVFDGFIGAERALNSQWAIQLGLGYDHAWNLRGEGSLIQGADVQSSDQFSYHYNVLSRQLLAEGKLLYNFKKCYHPYILLGLGAAFNEAADYSTNIPPFLTFTRIYKDNTQTSFTYTMGVGMDVDVMDHLRLGVSYRYADLGQVRLGRATIDTTGVGGTLSQTHLFASEILAQATIVF